MPIKKPSPKNIEFKEAVVQKKPAAKTLATRKEEVKNVTSKVLPKKEAKAHVKVQTAEGWKRKKLKEEKSKEAK